MTVLVPDAGRFDAVLAGLDGELVRRATRRERAVDLTMPLFRLASDLPAEEIARELGIEDLSTPRADLTGIAAAPLMVSQLLHQAVVTVDEKGTEAAAATAAVVVEMSLPAPGTPLVVDRPFLFWISETTTGAPLFLGAVTDPTA